MKGIKIKKTTIAVMLFCIILSLTIMPILATEFEQGYSDGEELIQYNDVFIPLKTESSIQEGSVVYHNFYDSVNGMHYSFYNTETGAHFAISDPKSEHVLIEDNGRAVRARRIAHEYSFSGSLTIDGKDNGVTFNVPSTTLYITGEAETVRASDGKITTSNYDSYQYSIEVCQDQWLLPANKKFYGIAGQTISGQLETNKDTYYLIITPIDRLADPDNLEGSGTLYYYD